MCLLRLLLGRSERDDRNRDWPTEEDLLLYEEIDDES